MNKEQKRIFYGEICHRFVAKYRGGSRPVTAMWALKKRYLSGEGQLWETYADDAIYKHRIGLMDIVTFTDLSHSAMQYAIGEVMDATKMARYDAVEFIKSNELEFTRDGEIVLG